MSQESDQASSSSSSLESSESESEEGAAAFFGVGLRGMGGPQARERMWDLTRSKRRWWVRVSCARERMRTVPSSQARASWDEEGFAAMDQMAPPCELIVR